MKLIALALSLLASIAWAAAGTLEQTYYEPGSSRTGFSAAFQLDQFDYDEVNPQTGGPFDTENGLIPGLRLRYEQPFAQSRFRFTGDLYGGIGTTEYNGAIQQTKTPVSGTTQDQIYDLSGTVGYDLLGRSSSTQLTAYLGLGSHIWVRDASGVSGGYYERYLWFYLPVGARLTQKISRRVGLVADASFRWNMGGSLHSSFIQQPIQDADGTLGMAPGARAEVSIYYLITEKLALQLSPFFEYAGIGQGNPFILVQNNGRFAGVAVEPSSHSYFYGASLGTTWGF